MLETLNDMNDLLAFEKNNNSIASNEISQNIKLKREIWNHRKVIRSTAKAHQEVAIISSL